MTFQKLGLHLSLGVKGGEGGERDSKELGLLKLGLSSEAVYSGQQIMDVEDRDASINYNTRDI
jgi:hypothetical protein